MCFFKGLYGAMCMYNWFLSQRLLSLVPTIMSVCSWTSMTTMMCGISSLLVPCSFPSLWVENRELQVFCEALCANVFTFPSLSVQFVLTLDDGLQFTPREKIHVFWDFFLYSEEMFSCVHWFWMLLFNSCSVLCEELLNDSFVKISLPSFFAD